MEVFMSTYLMTVVWIVVFLLFLGLEAVTTALVSIWFSLGSLVALIMEISGFSLHNEKFGYTALWVQILVAVVISLICIFTLGPVFRKKMKNKILKTNKDAYAGKFAQVYETITAESGGRAKLNGQEWAAVSEDGTEIMEGTTVEVVRVEGVKLIVRKK